MDNQIYKIYAECFPELAMNEEIFRKLLDADSCEIITHSENGSLAGFSAVQGNCIRLLCVSPEFQGKGIGSELLKKSEEAVSAKGFGTAVLGGFDSQLFIGAVTPEEQWNDMRCVFFENRGYKASNGCIEMKMALSDFSEDKIPPCPQDVKFGYCPEDRRTELREAVKRVHSDWLEYFDLGSPVFTAERDGKLAGFCIVDVNADTIISTGKNNIGMIGCVGVLPEFRRNGIGLAMVAKAMLDVKNQGCDEAFIHFTYLDWWYGKLGFKTFLHYWFGNKRVAPAGDVDPQSQK